MTVAKAVWNQIQSNDHRLMRRVHRWRAPRWFRILMIVATRGGDGWLWYALALILLFYGGPHRFAAIGSGVAAAASEFFCFVFLSIPAVASGLAKLSRTAGLRSCRRTNIPFPRAIPSRLSRIAISIGLFYPQLQGLPAGHRLSDCMFAHHSGHAFSERRAGGIGDWRDAGRGELLYFRGIVILSQKSILTSKKRRAFMALSWWNLKC